MAPQASGPDPADWLFAAVRGFHPLRWMVCLGGLAATWLVAAVAQTLFDGLTPRWGDWWEDPVGQARELGSQIADRSTLAIIIRLGLALLVAGAAWSLVGTWVARHELLARLRGRPDVPYTPPTPGPTGLVIGKLKDLVLCCPAVLLLAGFAFLPLLVATWINMVPGLGAIVVAILLPVVLLADVVLLLLLVGMLAWPLMSVTIATENSDTFDALSRAYNYSFARPIRFLVLSAIAVALAALPLVVVLYALDGPLAGAPALTRQILVFAGAGLSASVFWSLQTLVYLQLRAVMDGTDAREVAGAEAQTASADEPPAASVAEKSEPTGESDPGATPTSRLGMMVPSLLFFVGTWFFTAWLFMRSGGEESQWIGWGLFEGFVPPASGLYKVASVLAAIWGALWILSPIVVATRRPKPVEQSDPKSADASASHSKTE